MPQFGLFGSQVMHVGLLRVNFNGHAFHDFKTIAFNTHDFSRIVCNQANFFESQTHQNLCPDSIIPQISFEPQLKIGFNGITPLILKVVGPKFVRQTDSPSFLV
jgi:hypothetical protein